MMRTKPHHLIFHHRFSSSLTAATSTVTKRTNIHRSTTPSSSCFSTKGAAGSVYPASSCLIRCIATAERPSLRGCRERCNSSSSSNNFIVTGRLRSLLICRQLRTKASTFSSSSCSSPTVPSSVDTATTATTRSTFPSACVFFCFSTIAFLSNNDPDEKKQQEKPSSHRYHLQPNPRSASILSLSPFQPQPRTKRRGGTQMPCQYGSSIKTFTTTTTSASSDKTSSPLDELVSSPTSKTNDGNDKIKKEAERKDCPLCKKYSRGPCGQLFQSWLKCTDEHPGKDPITNEAIHLTKCAHLAKPLADCMNEHEEYYKNNTDKSSEDKDDDDDKEEEELKHAWMELIQKLEKEKGRKQMSFPVKIKPSMEIRLGSSMMGVAIFHSHYNDTGKDGPSSSSSSSVSLPKQKKSFILAYIKDQDGNILGAGGVDDLYPLGNDDSELALRFSVQKESLSITACALYEPEESDDDDSIDDQISAPSPIFMYTQLLPPKR